MDLMFYNMQQTDKMVNILTCFIDNIDTSTIDYITVDKEGKTYLITGISEEILRSPQIVDQNYLHNFELMLMTNYNYYFSPGTESGTFYIRKGMKVDNEKKIAKFNLAKEKLMERYNKRKEISMAEQAAEKDRMFNILVLMCMNKLRQMNDPNAYFVTVPFKRTITLTLKDIDYSRKFMESIKDPDDISFSLLSDVSVETVNNTVKLTYN